MFNKKSKTNPKSKSFGKLPINARIDISYENPNKPKIKFGYPHKKEQQGLADHATLHSVIFLIIFILLTWGLFILLLNSVKETIPYPQNCSVNFTYTNTYQGLVNGSVYYKSNKTIQGNQVFENMSFGGTGIYNRTLDGMNISCDGFNQSFILKRIKLKYDNPFLKIIANVFNKYVSPGFEENTNYDNTNPIILIILVILVYALAIGWLFLYYFLDKYIGRFMLKFKWYQKIIPEFNKRLAGRGYYKIIKPKDFPSNKIVELPLFKNIYLDYNVKGEFSKYLERVEIREHPFSKGIFRKGKLKKKRGNNYMLWRAQFIFKEIPKNGELIIWWKALYILLPLALLYGMQIL